MASGLFDNIPMEQGKQGKTGLFDNLPDEEEASKTAGSLRSFLGQGVAMGFGDEIEAFVRSRINGTSFDQEIDSVRQELDAFKRQNPKLALGTELAGAFTSALVPGGAALKGASLGAKLVRGAASGAAYGGVSGFGSAEGGLENRIEGAKEGVALGAAFGAGGQLAAKGIEKVAGKLASKEAAPTVEALKEKSQDLFDSVSRSGVRVRENVIQKILAKAINKATYDGYIPEVHGQTRQILDILQKRIRTYGTNINELQTIRSAAKGAAKSGSPESPFLGAVARSIDDVLDNIKTNDVTSSASNAKKAIEDLKEARETWKTFRKSELVQEAIDQANVSASQFSGSGAENAMRVQFKNLAKKIRTNNGLKRSFSADEYKAIEAVAKGGLTSNALRMVGKLAPSSPLGMLISIGVGGSLGGTVGSIVAPAIGFSARGLATKSTKSAVDRAYNLVRSGGKPPEQYSFGNGINRSIGASSLAIGNQ